MVKLITHCLHPSHELEDICFPNDEYICNGCNSSGNGFRYRCRVNNSPNCSNFNLHLFCATCPSSAPKSFLHPNHQLKLHTPQDNHKSPFCLAWVTRSPNKPIMHSTEEGLACELCELAIDDESQIFYSCKHCRFYVHPLCSQLPHSVNHGRHRSEDHGLTLRKSAEHRKCAVCGDLCRGWRYLCGGERCRVDIHIKCITTDTNTRGRSRWNIFEILTTLGVAVLGVVAPSAAGPFSALANAAKQV